MGLFNNLKDWAFSGFFELENYAILAGMVAGAGLALGPLSLTAGSVIGATMIGGVITGAIYRFAAPWFEDKPKPQRSHAARSENRVTPPVRQQVVAPQMEQQRPARAPQEAKARPIVGSPSVASIQNTMQNAGVGGSVAVNGTPTSANVDRKEGTIQIGG